MCSSDLALKKHTCFISKCQKNIKSFNFPRSFPSGCMVCPGKEGGCGHTVASFEEGCSHTIAVLEEGCGHTVAGLVEGCGKLSFCVYPMIMQCPLGFFGYLFAHLVLLLSTSAHLVLVHFISYENFWLASAAMAIWFLYFLVF